MAGGGNRRRGGEASTQVLVWTGANHLHALVGDFANVLGLGHRFDFHAFPGIAMPGLVSSADSFL